MHIHLGHPSAPALIPFEVVDGVTKIKKALIGEITAGMLTVGNSSNLLFNSGFDAGTDGWFFWGNVTGHGNHISTSQPIGIPLCCLNAPGTPDNYGKVNDAYPNHYNRVRVSPGAGYQGSCLMSAHGCIAQLVARWFDAAGELLAESVLGVAVLPALHPRSVSRLRLPGCRRP